MVSDHIKTMMKRFNKETIEAFDLMTKTHAEEFKKIETAIEQGDLAQLKQMIRCFLGEARGENNNVEIMRILFLRQIVTCGFPSVMNAFAVLKEIDMDEIQKRTKTKE